MPRFFCCLPLVLMVACTDRSDETGIDCDPDDTADTAIDCDASSGDGDGDGGDDTDGGSDNTIAIADAPPAQLIADVYSEGAFLRNITLEEPDSTLQANLSSGVLLVAGAEGTTMIQITLWQPVEVGESWSIEAMKEGIPQNATLVFTDEGEGGQATDGELTITEWYDTDSPQLKLVVGTFEADPIINPDQPGWSRELRSGKIEYMRVTDF